MFPLFFQFQNIFFFQNVLNSVVNWQRAQNICSVPCGNQQDQRLRKAKYYSDSKGIIWYVCYFIEKKFGYA